MKKATNLNPSQNVFTKNIGPSSDQLKSFLDFFIDSKKQLVLESSSLFSLLEFKNDKFLEVGGLVQAPVVSFSGIENSTSFIKEVNRLFSNISHNLIFIPIIFVNSITQFFKKHHN